MRKLYVVLVSSPKFDLCLVSVESFFFFVSVTYAWVIRLISPHFYVVGWEIPMWNSPVGYLPPSRHPVISVFINSMQNAHFCPKNLNLSMNFSKLLWCVSWKNSSALLELSHAYRWVDTSFNSTLQGCKPNLKGPSETAQCHKQRVIMIGIYMQMFTYW